MAHDKETVINKMKEMLNINHSINKRIEMLNIHCKFSNVPYATTITAKQLRVLKFIQGLHELSIFADNHALSE